MKRVLLFTLLLYGIPHAAVSFGFDANVKVNNTATVTEYANGDEEEWNTTRLKFGIYPSLIINPARRLEIVPTVGFEVTRTVQEHEQVNGNVDKTEQNPVDVAGGCGFFFRLVDNRVFRLSLGPDFRVGGRWNGSNSDYTRFWTFVSMPLNTDFMITSRFFFRMSPSLVKVTYSHEKSGNTVVNDFDFTGLSVWDVRMGFFWSF